MGQPYVVDQANDAISPGLYWGIWWASPFGQEFVPTLSYLDVFEFFTCRANGVQLGTDLVVVIHENDLAGRVVGTSLVVTVPYTHCAPTMFEFPESVPLVPGQTYVAELANIGGWDWTLGMDSEANYVPGCIYHQGVRVCHVDSWFREGVLAIPAESETWGRMKSRFR
jgi:hypothetical protein